ncbi:MAG: transposase family protein [Janthinobacterium lividum]
MERLLDLLDGVEDPRCSGKVEHRLTDILVIAVCAVIACAETPAPVLAGTHTISLLGSSIETRK